MAYDQGPRAGIPRGVGITHRILLGADEKVSLSRGWFTRRGISRWLAVRKSRLARVKPIVVCKVDGYSGDAIWSEAEFNFEVQRNCFLG